MFVKLTFEGGQLSFCLDLEKHVCKALTFDLREKNSLFDWVTL